MWLLGRVIPIMVGSLVPKDDECWNNFLLLRQIMDYLLSPRVTSDECAYIQLLIRDHHEAFVNLYPNKSVIPKMHNMIHMARIMLK